MADFFAELKRRHVYRVGAAYAVVAWVILQLVANVAPILELPPWIARTILLLLGIGFPVALIFAWVQQLGPASASGMPVRAIPAKLDWILVSALGVVVALILYQEITPIGGAELVKSEKARIVPSRSTASTEAGAVSIAVLPFVNLSSDPEQEFFSDGMTEEITAALAKVADLRVVARTSAFAFKGQNRDMQAIGKSLRATHLIEGSVRKAGDKVRITAQLIRTDDGTHIWSQNYDRQLDDIFAVQEDIATAIAAALRTPLGLTAGERLVSNRAISPLSYDQFLQARAILRNRNDPKIRLQLPNAIKMLEQVVARDPGYAPAWGLLAMMIFDGDRKEPAAKEAIRLDSRNPLGYAALGGVQAGRGDLAGAEDFYAKALAIDPNEPEVLDIASNRLASAGRIKEATILRERLRVVEPFAPVYNYVTASIFLINGQSKEAIPILEALSSAPPRNTLLARAYAAEGRYAEAADTLIAFKGGKQDRGPLEEAARLLRAGPTKVNDPSALPMWDQELSFVYLYVGAPERVLEYQERQTARYPNLGAAEVRYLWSPEFSPVRRTERFKTFVRKMGLVNYWRQKGWPDACHPTGGDDFTCV